MLHTAASLHTSERTKQQLTHLPQMQQLLFTFFQHRSFIEHALDMCTCMCSVQWLLLQQKVLKIIIEFICDNQNQAQNWFQSSMRVHAQLSIKLTYIYHLFSTAQLPTTHNCGSDSFLLFFEYLVWLPYSDERKR